MKNYLIASILIFIMIACERNSSVNNNTFDQRDIDKISKLDSLPWRIKKDYLESDSLIHKEVKREIEMLKKEISALKEELRIQKNKSAKNGPGNY